MLDMMRGLSHQRPYQPRGGGGRGGGGVWTSARAARHHPCEALDWWAGGSPCRMWILTKSNVTLSNLI